MMHRVAPKLLSEKVSVLVIGAGGTGSLLATDLARLAYTLAEIGHLGGGLDVVLADGDTVSAANVGRQSFYQSDIGLNKAEIVVHRINVAYGFAWRAIPREVDAEFFGNGQRFDIVISCVDSAAARREIHHGMHKRPALYWLDMGNSAHHGQCVLGEPMRWKESWANRLPTVMELYPELLDESRPEDNTPSCSLAEAVEKQGLFINRAMAMHGLSMLEQLLRKGEIEFSAAFVNLERGIVTNLPIDPAAWKVFGYSAKSRKPRPY